MFPIKCIAIKAAMNRHSFPITAQATLRHLTGMLLWLMLLGMGASVYAAPQAGTVTHLSGPLLAKKDDGTLKVLAQNSAVEQGDTLISEKDTYARIKFIDQSEITLKPNSQLKVDRFAFDEAKPENDNALFSLIKGGLRAVTGLLGKRSQERFGVNTPTATIGIRGTIFIADYVPALTEPAGRTPENGLAPGLYVHVQDGMVNLSNGAGSQNFAAGQFGYTPSLQQPPVRLPDNPGIRFAPPPAFSAQAMPQRGSGVTAQTAEVNCEVR